MHFVGHIPEGELPGYYRGAIAMPYVSMAEGFGLPILEAMASETPVITSDTSSMPEDAGDAALLVDPTCEGEISEALDRVVFDSTLRGELVRRGSERLGEFQWDDSADQLWNHLCRLALTTVHT